MRAPKVVGGLIAQKQRGQKIQAKERKMENAEKMEWSKKNGGSP